MEKNEDIPPYPVQATQAPQKKCRIGAAAPPIPLISPQQISFAVNAVPQFPHTRPRTTYLPKHKATHPGRQTLRKSDQTFLVALLFVLNLGLDLVDFVAYPLTYFRVHVRRPRIQQFQQRFEMRHQGTRP